MERLKELYKDVDVEVERKSTRNKLELEMTFYGPDRSVIDVMNALRRYLENKKNINSPR